MSAPSFDAAILDFDAAVGAVTLLASRCRSCATLAFPSRMRCGRCGGECDSERLPVEGIIHSLTELLEPVTIHPVPSTIALVQLADDVMVGGRLVGAGGHIGQRCRIVPLEVAHGEETLTAYAFEVVADA
jgi:uncharacterized OB-fold protein